MTCKDNKGKLGLPETDKKELMEMEADGPGWGWGGVGRVLGPASF